MAETLRCPICRRYWQHRGEVRESYVCPGCGAGPDEQLRVWSRRAAERLAHEGLKAALDHPFLRELFGHLEDASVWNPEAEKLFGIARSWFDVRDEALARARGQREDGDA